MTTITKTKSYSSFFRTVNADLITIQKYSIKIKNEKEQMRAIQSYWNRIVDRSFHWKKQSELELKTSSAVYKIQKYLKIKLIEECKQMIADMKKCNVSSRSSYYLKKELLSAFRERLLYIQNTF